MFTVLLLSSYSLLFAQQKAIDSLLQVLQSAKGEQKLEAISQLSKHLVDERNREAYTWIGQGLDLAEELDNDSIKAQLLKRLGVIHDLDGHTTLAIEHYRAALGLGRQAGDSIVTGDVLHNMSMVYRSLGSYEKSLELAFEALKVDLAIDNLGGLGYTYNNIGLLYEAVKDTAKALQFYRKSLAIREQINHAEGKGWVYINVGNLHFKADRYDSASHYYNRALEIFRAKNNKSQVAKCLANLGNIQYDKQNYAAAKELYLQAQAQQQGTISPWDRVYQVSNIGRAEARLKNFSKARSYLQELKILSDSLQSEELYSMYYKLEYQIEKDFGNYTAAIEALQKYHEYQNKLLNVQKLSRIQNLTDRYEIEKKDLEMAAIEKEKQLLQAVLAEREKTSLLKTATIVLLAAIGIAIYWAFYIKKKNLSSIEQKNTELESLNQALDRFVYSASHDLRAPLLSALGLTQLMHQETNLQQLQLYMQMQEKSLKKLDAFVCEILDYSRNVRTEVKFEPVSLGSLAENTFAQLAFDTQSEKVEKRVLVPEDLQIFTDRQRLQVIINNLVSNAIRYQHPYQEQPFVEISASLSQSEVIITVADNGIGIPESHQQRVYDMFYRAHDHQNGSGLGLFIVKEAVDKLRGTINLQSTEGKGTIFTIKLPGAHHLQPAKTVRQSI